MRAKRDLKHQLSEFREKRRAGLGFLYGPEDSELQSCSQNKSKELQVIEDTLLPFLQEFS